MLTPTNLIFSNFQPQELQCLYRLLCSVFRTSPAELAKLYQDIISTFQQPDWPLHFVQRDFFISTDKRFQHTYQESPVVAVDFPSLIELNDGRVNKSTIAIIGQDSKNDNDYEHLVVGTPYGLHHKGSREELNRTKLYFEMIQVLLQLGYRVYLTDIFKLWVCNPARRYTGIRLPHSDRQCFLQLLQLELELMQPVAMITWGKQSCNTVYKLQLGIQHLNFPHPSGAANGAWKRLINKTPTRESKLAYWRSVIAKELESKYS